MQKGSSVDGTPSKKRRIDQPVESPRKRKKREQPSTPVHQVIREAVVERSPAVAVSGKILFHVSVKFKCNSYITDLNMLLKPALD